MKEIGTFKIDKNMCSNCREDENCPQKYSINGNCLYIEKDLKKEQVPETWEDLKELCKDLKGLYKNYNIEVFDDAIFVLDSKVVLLKIYDDGEIKDSVSEVIAENRTPKQMYQIIKNLIGEE